MQTRVQFHVPWLYVMIHCLWKKSSSTTCTFKHKGMGGNKRFHYLSIRVILLQTQSIGLYSEQKKKTPLVRLQKPQLMFANIYIECSFLPTMHFITFGRKAAMWNRADGADKPGGGTAWYLQCNAYPFLTISFFQWMIANMHKEVWSSPTQLKPSTRAIIAADIHRKYFYYSWNNNKMWM